jgi:ABC-2 type transport system ATP-binding protein
MATIEAEALSKTFPGDVRAVRGINISVEAGSIFGFLGPNGAGKSTTVKILTTLLKPTSGHARVGGFDTVRHASSVRKLIGVALQEAGLDELQTGAELLVLQGRLYGLGRKAAERRAGELLDLLGLADAAGRLVKTYSGGMKRRLDVAAALVLEPEVLFLDEPTTGLDPASRLVVWDLIKKLNRDDGVTVFLTTQYLEEADRLCDELAIIDHGSIVAEGTPAALKADIGADVISVHFGSRLDGTQLESSAKEALGRFPEIEGMQVSDGELTIFARDGASSVPAVIRALDESGLHPASVTVASPTLDDVFLKQTGYRLEGASQE